MRQFLIALVLAFASTASVIGQDFQKCVKNTSFHFIDTSAFDISLLDPPPPPDRPSILGDGRLMLDYELGDLYLLQDSRTREEVKKANVDALELDIFIFRTVMGDRFNASNPALVATARLSQDLCEESTALATIQKKKFNRTRPYLVDKAIKPATDVMVLQDSPSYPSGHSLTGYLEGLALSDILPEKRDAILSRAEEFARERNLLGVHYPSDIFAGRLVAYALYAQISKSQSFRQELDAARVEIMKRF